MKIQVLGTGCTKCNKLKESTVRAVAEAGLDCEVESVTDLAEIVSFDVMMTPALVIDGKVMVAGSIPPVADIGAWIREADAKDSDVN
jgi:small redox-active disulfide protein 2